MNTQDYFDTFNDSEYSDFEQLATVSQSPDSIADLRQQLAAVTAERDKLNVIVQQLRAMIGFVAPTAPDAVKRLEILARTNDDLAFWQLTAINITGAFEDVVSERDRYRAALEYYIAAVRDMTAEALEGGE